MGEGAWHPAYPKAQSESEKNNAIFWLKIDEMSLKPVYHVSTKKYIINLIINDSIG